MYRYLNLALCLGLNAGTLLAGEPEQTKAQKRLENCGVVMQEVLDIPDNIPRELLDKAECVVVIPSMTKVVEVLKNNAPHNDSKGTTTPCHG
jgi:lipid-binding SYLF domain-containing protein